MHASLAGPHAIAPERMTPDERAPKIVAEAVAAARREAPAVDGLAVDLRTDGLGAVVREMLSPTPEEAVA